MLKIARYIKRFLPILLVAVVLLFGQAILELNLPNMMSDIVNVGIQKGGIEEVAPKAVAGDAYDLMLRFMNEEDTAAMQAAYTAYDEATAAQQADADKAWPKAADKNAMLLTGGGAAADAAFGHGGYALMEFFSAQAEASGESVGESDAVSADIDFEALRQALPVLMAVPNEALQEYVQLGAAAPDMMTGSVAAVLNKAFYGDLGADTGRIQTNYILRVGLIMVLLAVALMACAVGATYCFARMGAGVARDLRRDIFAKVNSFSNSEMDKFSTASLITRTTNDVTQVQGVLTMGMRMLVFAPVMGTGAIIMALRKSANMSWILLVAVAIIMVVIIFLYIFVMPRFKRMQKLVDRLNLVSRENLSGIMVVRAFSNQKFQQERFEKANKDLTANSLFVGRAITLMMPIMMLVLNGVSLFIVWVGAEQIAASSIQVGDMMAFIQYAMHVIMSFLFIAMIFIMIPRASVSAERIDEVLRSETTIHDPKNPQHFSGRPRGEIRFNHVSFRYAGADEDVLSDISFTAQPGQTTAFIGSTGSGKSTLINLIPRFYDVNVGSITLDGVDVRDVTQHELRQYIGYVPQKGLLFSGDISENLRYGDEGADDATLRAAAEVAQATEFIDTLDDGFSTDIAQGGTNVSGGQRQRLSIARALVKKAPVYIFDDSFSALDFATDARLRTALKPYTEDATVLIVAQRVSTIMKAEQIIVLDEGKIVGIGTHSQLLQGCQAYREIAESQLSQEELA